MDPNKAKQLEKLVFKAVSEAISKSKKLADKQLAALRYPDYFDKVRGN